MRTTIPIPILMYHQVDAAPPRGTPARGMVVSPGSFARQMRMLAVLGWRGVAMRDVVAQLDAPDGERIVGITFDDGYLNNLEHAVPILQRHGFSATCYAVSSLIGDFNRWDDGKGIARKPLMNADHWRRWVDAGMEIGAHGRRHLDLTTLDDEAARDEIAGSRDALEALFAVPVRHFCYPYGRFEARHRAIVAEAGFASATTVRRGRATRASDRLELPRVLVAQSTHLGHFLLKVATGYEDRRG
ncbi:MAG TPA: polysaccharide deacetylase family protein [Burkholderiaceae bacterium]|nr:polysaccharide deacetylase family protein [Burkholderiaceae bacterium]